MPIISTLRGTNLLHIRPETGATCSTSTSRLSRSQRLLTCTAKRPKSSDVALENRKPLFQKFSTTEEESIMYRSSDDLAEWDRQDFSRVYDEGEVADPLLPPTQTISLLEPESAPSSPEEPATTDAATPQRRSSRLNLRGFADEDEQEEATATAEELDPSGTPYNSRTRPRPKVLKRPYAGWYTQPGLTVRALHDLVLQNCERGEISLGALYTMFQLAGTPQEARMTLSALSTTRLAIVQQRQALRPFSPSFTGKFVKMCVRCGAPDVLLDAMRRCNDLGLDFSLRAIHYAMKHYATNLDLEPLEEIFRTMPDAGLYPNTWSRSCIVRAFLNADQLERAQDLLDEFEATKARVVPSILNLMAYARRRRSARAMMDQ